MVGLLRQLWFQVLIGPIKIVREIGGLFLATRHLRDASIEENVASLHKDLIPHFNFLQEFYLYSAQFFAHTSYALMVLLVSVFGFAIGSGFTVRRVGALGLAYVLSGLFFVLGRVQFRSLFHAEEQLVKRGEISSLGV